MRNQEIKQTFSITLPANLYIQLVNEVGKGKTSKFIKELVEKELKKTEKKSLRDAYQALENCSEYQEEAEEWEKANLEDSNEEDY